MALLDSKVEKTGVFSAGRALLTDKTLRTDRWWLQPLMTFSVLILLLFMQPLELLKIRITLPNH